MSGYDKISIFLVGIDIEIWIEKHLLTVTISRFSQFIYGDYDIEFGKWIRLISFGGKEDEEWMKHLLILDVHTEFNSRPHVSRDVRLKYLKVTPNSASRWLLSRISPPYRGQTIPESRTVRPVDHGKVHFSLPITNSDFVANFISWQNWLQNWQLRQNSYQIQHQIFLCASIVYKFNFRILWQHNILPISNSDYSTDLKILTDSVIRFWHVQKFLPNRIQIY
jgi:hypothetical protein